MQTISKYRLLVLCGILAFGLVNTGCDGDNSKLVQNNNGDKKADGDDNNGDDKNGDDTKSPDPDEDTKSADPDDVAEETDVQVTPGFMNGTWRVATVEDDVTVTTLNLTHIEGDPVVQGNSLMGEGLYDGNLVGGDNQLDESSFDGTTLTIQWNPMAQDTEMMTLSATKVDDNTLDGNITAKLNVELDMAVKITREE